MGSGASAKKSVPSSRKSFFRATSPHACIPLISRLAERPVAKEGGDRQPGSEQRQELEEREIEEVRDDHCSLRD